MSELPSLPTPEQMKRIVCVRYEDRCDHYALQFIALDDKTHERVKIDFPNTGDIILDPQRIFNSHCGEIKMPLFLLDIIIPLLEKMTGKKFLQGDESWYREDVDINLHPKSPKQKIVSTIK